MSAGWPARVQVRQSAPSNAQNPSTRLQPLQGEGGCQLQVGSLEREGVRSVIDDPEGSGTRKEVRRPTP